jgi:hypothetical protein
MLHRLAESISGLLKSLKIPSQGEGVGAWIQANFSQPTAVKEIKILQRHNVAEANR